MISKKILYSEQLLQLVLALSLLQVDPVNYLEWGIARIHASDGSPWQLEVSHQPFSEFPYMGRKHYAPFIEDLTRFDNRFRGNDLQAYLLNLSDDLPSNNSNNNTANDQSNGNSTDSHIAPTLNLMQQLNESNIEELFLHSDSHHALGSNIIEQNLADLNDYGEIHEAASPLRSAKIEFVDDPWDEFIRLQDVEISSQNHQHELGTLSSSFSWDQAFDVYNDSTVANKSLHDDEASKKKEEQIKENTETSDDVNELSNISSVELTAEEMDLIEVLWKQDVDLGYNPLPTNNPSLLPAQKESKAEDDVEKLKALLDEKPEKNNSNNQNPWEGLRYTVDTETGEYILSSSQASNDEELDEILLKEALQFVTDSDTKDIGSEVNSEEVQVEPKKSSDSSEETEDLEAVLNSNLGLDSGLQNDDLENLLNSPLTNLFDETDDIFNDMMIQSSASHFQHPRQPPQNYPHCVNGYRQNNYQGRVPLARSTTMEQRWQDLANLLSFPPAMGMTDMSAHSAAAHYPPHYYQASSLNHSHPAVLHNASLAEIVSQSQPSTSHHLQPYSGSNLGSAVATSMHLTNSTSETDAGNSAYKMDHDMMYYSQANPNELNHTSDGFLNMLKDEDLQLMDMAMNEGLYTMGMLDQNGSASAAAAAAGNPHLTNGLMSSHLPANLSSGLGTTMVNSTNASGSDRLDASSDSAVSSMGSERVASLSDGEWNEGSDSAQEYNVRKFIGPYDYRFGGARMLDSNRHPVAQKKHQMFGKRFAHDTSLLAPPPPAMHHPHSSLVPEAVPNVPMKFEPYDNFTGVESAASSSSQVAKASTSSESEMKYSYTLDYHHRHMKNGSGASTQELVNHNHTYTLPPPPHGPQLLNNNGANPRPQTRDKKSKKAEDEHITRDEKRARALQIPIPVYDIINLPMDEFNERLSKYDLSENQLSLIRDIRRRGKNKVAAQNCRKRKLDQIISLADEVKDMKMRKDRFLREHDMLLTERRRIKDKFSALYRHVFTNLRDPEGNPYSSYQYSLQQSADGGIVLVPRSSDQSDQSGSNSTTTSRSSGHGNSGNGGSSNFK